MTLFGDEDEQDRDMRGLLPTNTAAVPKVQGVVVPDAQPPVRRRRCVQGVPPTGLLEGRSVGRSDELHLTQTHDRGYPVWHARYGQTGVSGLDCPLQLAAKCCREAVRHLERERECGLHVLDEDGLSTGVKREGRRAL